MMKASTMTLNLHALLIFLGCCALIAFATLNGSGAWFHLAEAASTIVILAGIAGLLNRHGTQRG
jgi:hypothetical protein